MSDERNPWSVRGVSREARAKAAKAARRRRMTMGEWVDYVLTSSANAELGSRPPAGHPTHDQPEAATSAPAAAALAIGADRLEQRLVSVERREKDLIALVERAVSRSGATPVPDPDLRQEISRIRSMGEAIHGLVQRIDTALRPLAQIGALIRRVEEGEQRQRQIVLLMERMVANEVRRKDEIASLAAALARLERRAEPRPADRAAFDPSGVPAIAAPTPRPEPIGLQRFDFAALNEQAVMNSRRAGQREGAPRRGLFGRRGAQPS